MTPPDMVTDHDAAHWLSWLDGVAPKPQPITVAGIIRATLAFRERTLGLLAGLLPAVECPWEEDGTCTPENCMKEEARELLEALK